MDQSSPCQVLIIDDQQMFREGLKACLQNRSTVHVCGELSYPQVELTDYKSTFPKVILAGIPQNQEFGLDFIEALRARFPDAQVLAVVEKADARLAEKALKAGAMGVITRDKGVDEFMRAIETIGRDQVFLDKELAHKLLQRAFPHIGMASREARAAFGNTSDKVL